MLTSTHAPSRQLFLGLALGVLATTFLLPVGSVLAQTPSPSPIPTPAMQQMVEWCRQMMAQAGGMMSGMCMGR
jgi:hypothetical protein